MNNYNPKKFIERLSEKMNGRNFPVCPYCGGQTFTSTDSAASVLIGKDLSSIYIGPSIPAGIVVCDKCGHIELFALGALGLLPKEEESKNG